MTRVESSAVDELVATLPAGTVVTDEDVMAGFTQDWSCFPKVGRPLAVVRAGSEADVQTTLRLASKHLIPVVPRGAGSGLSGGATAVEGGIVLSLERLSRIRVDPAMRVAFAEAGALNVDVKKAATAHGLWYPPDPSSFEICSIGGNAATNAGGMCCVKYGVTTDYVLGLHVVLADGTMLELGGPRLKDSAGLSLTKLFVGSEGTLGVITEVTLRLLPQPLPSSTLVASFATLENAVTAVVEIVSAVRPSTLELMDRPSINAVEDALSMDLDRKAAALLVARSDVGASELNVIEQACRHNHAGEVYTTDDEDEGEAFLAARRAVLPSLERKGDLLIEDVGVPIPLLPELVRQVEAIAARHKVQIAIVAHAGDGNTHPTIVYDAKSPEESRRAQLAFGEIMRAAVDLGGTITGEHGVGRFKQPFLAEYLGPDVMALSRRLKETLDPLGILNPGVMF